MTRLLRSLLWWAWLGVLPLTTQAAAPPDGCPPAAAAPGAAEVQAASRQARDRGVLWRLDKGGRSSWLFGTIHVGKLEWAFAGPRLKQAFADSDVLALELNPLDPEITQQAAAAMQARIGDEVLPAALQQRLQRQVAVACLGNGALAGLPPLMQLVALNLVAARRDALDAAFGQELVLASLAQAAGRRIVSLETVEQQIAALLPEAAQATRRQFEQDLTQLEDGRSRAVLQRLAQAWADGDLQTIESHAAWCGCADTEEDRAQLRRLNDERNAPLADAIAALHAGGARVLAAVGALHMTGPQALPRLLAQRGFHVQRIAF